MTADNLPHHKETSDSGTNHTIYRRESDNTAQSHDKVESHKPLINTLTHKDWHADKIAAKSDASSNKHLPLAEIANQTKSQSPEHLATLQNDLANKKRNISERLEAAHKLLQANNNEVVAKDEGGKALHLHITASKKGEYTHIVVSNGDKGNSKQTPYLEGDVDKNGKAVRVNDVPVKVSAPETNVPVEEHKHLSPKHNTVIKDQDSHNHHPQHLAKQHGDETQQHEVRHSRPAALAQQLTNVDSSPAQTNPPQNFSPTPVADYSLNQTTTMPIDSSGKLTAGDMDGQFQLGRLASNSVVDKLIKIPGGGVYLRTSLAVDADGGSDAKNDPNGQSITSLTNSNGTALDAKNVCYFVLPLGGQWSDMGIKPGDLAWVRNTVTGKMVPAIFGDKGPSNKIGEGSQALCRALGLSDNPNSGGTNQKNIEFLIVPHSGTGNGDIAKSTVAMAEKLGSSPALA